MLMLIILHVKIFKHLINIVYLIYAQCSFLIIINYLNIKNFLYLSQVLNLK